MSSSVTSINLNQEYAALYPGWNFKLCQHCFAASEVGQEISTVFILELYIGSWGDRAQQEHMIGYNFVSL